jgi:hypothetical protein
MDKTESSGKNSFTLGVSGVARLTLRRDSPRRARSKTARVSRIGPQMTELRPFDVCKASKLAKILKT